MPVIETTDYEKQVADFKAARPDVNDPDDAYAILFPHPSLHEFRHLWFRKPEPAPEPQPEPTPETDVES